MSPPALFFTRRTVKSVASRKESEWCCQPPDHDCNNRWCLCLSYYCSYYVFAVQQKHKKLWPTSEHVCLLSQRFYSATPLIWQALSKTPSPWQRSLFSMLVALSSVVCLWNREKHFVLNLPGIVRLADAAVTEGQTDSLYSSHQFVYLTMPRVSRTAWPWVFVKCTVDRVA
jgi:hypothetical protein